VRGSPGRPGPLVGDARRPPRLARMTWRARTWGLRFRFRESLERSWLVIPSIYVVAALALGLLVPSIPVRQNHPLGVSVDDDSARAILQAVASGVIAFTGLVVSVAVLVVHFGAGHPAANWEELLDLALTEIREFGGGSHQVCAPPAGTARGARRVGARAAQGCRAGTARAARRDGRSALPRSRRPRAGDDRRSHRPWWPDRPNGARC